MDTLALTRGSSVAWTMTWLDGDNVPFDLTDATLEVVQHSLGRRVEITTEILTPYTDGRCVVRIDKDETMKIRTGTHVIRVRIVFAGGDSEALEPQTVIVS